MASAIAAATYNAGHKSTVTKIREERQRKKKLERARSKDELAALMVALDLTISVHTSVLQMAAAVKEANVWVVPAIAYGVPFHRLLKSPVPYDIDSKRKNDKEKLPVQVEAAVSILTEATKKIDPSKWITEISSQETEDGRLYPTAI